MVSSSKKKQTALPPVVTEKPLVFIGSSSEGLLIAKQLQVGLSHIARCQLWTQGVFALTRGTLESLIAATKSADFAILVLTADDLATKRGKRRGIPRDNVIFELGLFMGALGRERTFIVHSREKLIELPSDLAGITTATFSEDENLRLALGEVCTLLEEALKQRGKKAEDQELAGVMADLLGEWKSTWYVDDRYEKTCEFIADNITFTKVAGEKIFAKGVNKQVGNYDLVGRVSPNGVITFYYHGDAQRHFSGGVVILKLKTNSRRLMHGLWYEYDADRSFYGGETTWEKY